MQRPRVFLSAVSSDLGKARVALRHDAELHGWNVAIQEELYLGAAGNLLGVLDAHIRECQAVVCLIGSRSGAGFPTDTEVAAFLGVLPPELPKASYTQWEYFLARRHGIVPLVCRPGPRVRPDVQARRLKEPDDADLQEAFIRYVERTGIPRSEFGGLGDLGRYVGRQLAAIRQRLFATTSQASTGAVPGPTQAKPTVLPYSSLGTLFKGRDDFLAQLRNSLTQPNAPPTAITSNFAIHGLGGIGKTRAAVEYAWRHHDDYTALLAVIAETPDALTRNLAALTGALGLPGLDAATDDVRLAAVLDWLNRNPGWLLILDNVDTEDALAAVTALTAKLTHGHVLLTCRLTNLPDGFQGLELDVLTVADSAAYLLDRTDVRRRRAPDDVAQAEGLARELGQLALALTHAAAYIRRVRCSLAEYRDRLARSFDAVVNWSDPAVTHYPRAIAATWALSVQRLTEPGRALLERLAFLAPDPVPLFLLDVPVPGVEAEDAREALADLAAYSLVTHDTEAPAFSVHRLVLDVTRRGLPPDQARARLEQALGWVNAAFVGAPDDVRTWPRLDPLAEHAEVVAVRGEEAGIAEPTGRLMNQLGVLLYMRAQYGRAERLMHAALANAERHRAKDDPEVATRIDNLALLLRVTNRLGEAEPLIRRALAIDNAHYDAGHPRVAIRLNNLAGLLRATNRLREAEPLYRRALAIDETHYGAEHPNVAIRLNNLAMLLRATNSLGEAEPLYRRALAIFEARYGAEHPNVATNLNNLAQLLRATNRLREAEPLMRRALAIDEASYGAEHPNVAIHLNNLAQLLQATNRLEEAEPLMRCALSIDEASYGAEHPRAATDLNNLARLLQDTNRLEEAGPLMRRALSIFLAFQRDTGHAHPHRDLALNNYAALLRQMGRTQDEITAELQALHREAGLT